MLAEKERRIYDRIAHWRSPSDEQILELMTIRTIATQLLYAMLMRCPDNLEREEALEGWQWMLNRAEESVKRG